MGHMAGIADQPETFFRTAQDIADGIDGIVEDGKTLHREIANGKGLPCLEGMPRRLDARFAQHVGSSAGGIEGNIALLEKCFQTAHVVAVFVGEEDAIDGIRPELLGAGEQLLGTESGIDEESGMSGFCESGIATAAAAEDCELHADTMPENTVIGQVLPRFRNRTLQNYEISASCGRMIRFTFFGIPVEIQPWFWITMALLGSNFGQSGATANEALAIALFVIAGAISIFVHELGHAFAGIIYKARPFIVLQAFGGYAAFPHSRFTRVQDFIVTAAGPVVQLILGGLAIVAYNFFPDLSEAFRSFIFDLIIVSIFWAILNMIPVYPLDGGQMMAAVLGPQRRKLCLKLSIGVAIVVSVIMLVFQLGIMLPIFMLYYAYLNYQELSQTYR